MSTEEDKKSEAGAGSVVEDETMDSADAPKPALVSKHNNPDVPTIEQELDIALQKTGLLTAENHGELYKVCASLKSYRTCHDFQQHGWSRTARTDKGVHAAAQVVGVKLRIEPGHEEEAVNTVNAELPPIIRVFQIQRTTKSFNGKIACTGRHYEYLLPTSTLKPAPGPYLPAVARNSAIAAGTCVIDPYAEVDTPIDAYKTGEAIQQGRVDAWAARRAAAATAKQGYLAAYLAHSPVGVPAAPATEPLTVAAATTPDAFQTGAAFQAGRGEGWRVSTAAAAEAATGQYRVPDRLVKRMRETLKLYEGAHPFHNFTPRVKYGNPSFPAIDFDVICHSLLVDSSLRFIMECTCSDPLMIEGVEFLLLKIRGQSFMLHQIRNMVGLAVDIVRGAAVDVTLPLALSDHIVHTPMAPATGLFLYSCYFRAYNRKFAHVPSIECTSEPLASRIEAFKHDVILPHIAKEVVENNPFDGYINTLNNHPLGYQILPTPPVVNPNKAKQASNPADSDDEGKSSAAAGQATGDAKTAAKKRKKDWWSNKNKAKGRNGGWKGKRKDGPGGWGVKRQKDE